MAILLNMPPQLRTALILLPLLAGCGDLRFGSEGRRDHNHVSSPFTLLWGNNTAVVKRTAEGLRQRGFQVVDSDQLPTLLSQHTRLTGTADEISQLLHLGNQLQAELLVYVRALVRPLTVRRPSMAELPEPAGERDTRYWVQVWIDSYDIRTEERVWRGTAWLRYPLQRLEDATVDQLACLALAAALGETPQLTGVQSNVCTNDYGS